MKYLVDAGTILDFFNGKTELFDFFDNTENIYVSSITIGELNFRARIENSACVQQQLSRILSLFQVINHIQKFPK